MFYPVEQQSAIENKSQSSKAGGGTEASSTVSSSPPEIGTGRLFDERQESGGIPTIPSNAPSGFQSLPLEPGSAISSQGTDISTPRIDQYLTMFRHIFSY